MILFGSYTGQRLGDIASLDWSNIDLDKQVLTMVTVKTKTRLRIPIAGPLFDHIAQLPTSGKTHPKVPPLSFHSLRHTAVSMLYASGIPAATAQALIGHDSDAVHQLYTRLPDRTPPSYGSSSKTLTKSQSQTLSHIK